MNITVLGFSHFGFVAAACAARHFKVTSLDFDDAVLARLTTAQTPHPEPGLEDLIAEGLESRRLRFTTNVILACVNADILWVAWNPPVNAEDSTIDHLRSVLHNLSPGTVVLISSPIPIRSCATLQREFPQFHFACALWKLPYGRAIAAFEKMERVIVGVHSDSKIPLLERLFDPFTDRIDFMRTEVVEMLANIPNGIESAADALVFHQSGGLAERKAR